MLPIQINGNPVETSPSPSGQQLASHYAAHHTAPLEDTPATNYLVIQTRGPVHSAEKTQLAVNNIKIHEVVSPNTYLCSYKDQDSNNKPSADDLRVNLESFVVFADIYRPGVVVERALKDTGTADSGTVSVDILVHSGVDVNSIVEQIAAEAGISPSDVQVLGSKLRVTVPQVSLASVAAIDQVKTINALPVFRAFNNKAKDIMDVHKGIGPQASKVFKGKGQTVCVADTGFDTGKLTSPEDYHEAFTDRVLKLFPLGRPSTGESSDPSGHGTHVCGSVLGVGNHESEGVVEAPASEATLIVQSLFDRFYNTDNPDPRRWEAGFGGIPDAGISALFVQATAEGASVHTNSYGSYPDLHHVASQQEIFKYREAITADIDAYLHQNRNLVVLFAAGNSGSDTDNQPGRIDSGSIGAEATSKNIITVGASENNRPNQLYPGGGPLLWGAWFDHAPLNTDNVANNPEGLAAWSSRGPSKPDGRIKPDVVAPGTTILSARSSAIAPPEHFYDGWGISSDKKWCFSGGTSMACPLVAGCCAVIRGAMVDRLPNKQPPATAVKAVLINGAVPIKGQYHPQVEFKAPPNFDYGFGRVNLHNSLLHVVPNAPGTAGYGTGPALADNGVDPRDWTHPISIPQQTGVGDAELTLKVTVTWADRPGAWLQNNLNLTVTEGGETLWGNGVEGNEFEGGDRLNNVEQVTWKGVKKGRTYRVKVRAYSIPDDDFPQDFSYAWRIFS